MATFTFTSGSGATSNGSGGLTVNETGHVTTVTIGVSGSYAIDASGAQGGAGVGPGHTGGLGAAIGGDVYLQAGEKLEIVVGGEGGNAIGAGGGGGGGGSFVIELSGGPQPADTILAVAGGGGGGALGAGSGGHGSSHGGSGLGVSYGFGGSGGQPGQGGGVLGGGGGGFTGGGGGFTGGGGGSGGNAGSVGSHFLGGAGVSGVYGTFSGGSVHNHPFTDGAGGFGGGGGGAAAGGGGGGGYGGGGGGGDGGSPSSGGGGGGGGGSYLDGTATTDQGDVHSGNGEVTLTLVSTVCFVSGTLIRTARDEVAVEDLAVGDRAVTAGGEARPIQWIAHRRIERPSREHWPVRVTAGAFGEGLPVRDLFLSPGHAVCVDVMDEVFVPVGELINGATIAQVEVPEVTYWHVELESHDVLSAAGLPCESYMDAGNRAFFGKDYGRLGEIDPRRVEASLARYARPFVNQGPVVAAIRERLAARAEALGWTQTSDIDLHLVVDGQRVQPEIDAGLARFIFPSTAREARLVSRTFVPERDRRSLGVCIMGLRISDGLRHSREVALDDLTEGFHDLEQDDRETWRWTDGSGVLPASIWADCNGLAVLHLAFKTGVGRAWMAPEGQAVRAAA